MPEKTKEYARAVFPPELIREAVDAITRTLPDKERRPTMEMRSIELVSGEEWTHDTDDEFFADYRKGFSHALFAKTFAWGKGVLRVLIWRHDTKVTVTMPTRDLVENVFELFESNVEKCRLPMPTPEKQEEPRVRIFIGHGHDPQWKDLKDHLHDMHNYEVEAYEIGARGGVAIKEVLDELLTKSSFALLVMTAEDEDATGTFHARENVIHELGLFQGRLGWRKAIALVEEGVSEFSNIHGLNQIRFGKGRIRESFGDVVATIKREFQANE